MVWTDTLILVTAAIALMTTILGLVNRKKIDDVHVTINHRLDEWMAQTQTTIGDLKDQRDKKEKSDVQSSGKDQ
jgi:hypothetical protein